MVTAVCIQYGGELTGIRIAVAGGDIFWGSLRCDITLSITLITPDGIALRDLTDKPFPILIFGRLSVSGDHRAQLTVMIVILRFRTKRIGLLE